MSDALNKINYRVTSGVKISKQFSHDEIFSIINHQVHDGFRHQISGSFRDNFHVRIDQVTNGFNLLNNGINKIA